jgi:excisionase family DNA binding protein
MKEPLRNYDEAAAWLGVSRAWLEEQVRAGGISYVKLGRQVRFTQAHLDDLVTAREVSAHGGLQPSGLTGELSPAHGQLTPMRYRRRRARSREAEQLKPERPSADEPGGEQPRTES